MPSADRRNRIWAKVRHDFRTSRRETHPEKIDFLLRFADTALDNLRCHVRVNARKFSNAVLFVASGAPCPRQMIRSS